MYDFTYKNCPEGANPQKLQVDWGSPTAGKDGGNGVTANRCVVCL